MDLLFEIIFVFISVAIGAYIGRFISRKRHKKQKEKKQQYTATLHQSALAAKKRWIDQNPDADSTDPDLRRLILDEIYAYKEWMDAHPEHNRGEAIYLRDLENALIDPPSSYSFLPTQHGACLN